MFCKPNGRFIGPRTDEPGEDSGSFSPVETYESESVAILKDNVFYDEEQLMMLNKLTRSLMFRPMWKNRISAFSVMSGYILAFSTFARFCYFFDQYGCGMMGTLAIRGRRVIEKESLRGQEVQDPPPRSC
nr:unnamed protein product [Haemonchus contortus]